MMMCRPRRTKKKVKIALQGINAGVSGGGAAMRSGATAGGADANKSVWLNYNPADYKTLNISPEIKDLFKHITKYVAELT